MASTQTENLAKLACAYAGAVWGVFWIPLRALNDVDIAGAWATVVFYIVPLIIIIPLFFMYWRRLISGGWRLHLIGIVAGLSLVLYSDALIYTEVIRGMLLYYMTPVWSTLLARIWLKEPITAARIVAIILGFSGMLIIFGIDVGIPWPRNVGDWMGLASGLVWAVAAVLMRKDEKAVAIDYCLVYFLWGSVASVIIALMSFSGGYPIPSIDAIASTLPWLVPILLVIVIPAVFAVFWGTPLLSPGIVGIMFMTEISVGAITAAIWAGEPFGAREISGILLITMAGLTEVIAGPLARFRSSRRE
ncbi:MAG: DMT family transporter [Rhodospirillaceae bacterium]|nr:DMT family transporter [Rhodospirillaceae bacterium]